MFVVRDVKVQYLRPATLDDELVHGVPSTTWGASMVMRQRVAAGRGIGRGRDHHRLCRPGRAETPTDAGRMVEVWWQHCATTVTTIEL